MTEWPALCTSPHCRPTNHGGPRPTQSAWICPTCIDHLRQQLGHGWTDTQGRHHPGLSEMWADLQDNLGAATGHGSADDGKQRHGRVTIGLVINEAVSDAMSATTAHVWFLVRTVLDIADSLDRDVKVPADQDTPTLAAWVADWHTEWLVTRTGRFTAAAIVEDTTTIHRQVRRAAYPTGSRKVETGLPCEARDDQGTPCTGLMVAHLRDTYDGMPDLTCTTDRAHTMAPDVWEREGWKRRHRDMAPGAATRLAQAIAHA